MRKPLDVLRITSAFGPRVHPVTGKESTHDGVDYAAPVGEPVFAPLAGVIKSISRNDIGGLQVVLESSTHRFGVAHLSEAIAVVGQRIGEGDVFALVGKSGRVTGPHLHIGARDLRTGKLVNPDALWAFSPSPLDPGGGNDDADNGEGGGGGVGLLLVAGVAAALVLS